MWTLLSELFGDREVLCYTVGAIILLLLHSPKRGR